MGCICQVLLANRVWHLCHGHWHKQKDGWSSCQRFCIFLDTDRITQVTQQQGFTHESHSFPLQDYPSVLHLWWLQIKAMEDCQRTCQEVCCSSAQHCQQESQTKGATLENIGSAADEPHSGP